MYCTKCGKELLQNSRVCANCGADVTTQPSLYLVAKQSKRLLNYILDIIFIYVLVILVAIVISLLGGEKYVTENTTDFLTIAVMLFYFIFFESLFQKTPAKFITKTRVVKRSGEKPSFKNIVGRSFARFIPFDAFSFLGGKYPEGWHDRFSKTIVVSDKYSKEDIRKIEPNKEKNSKVIIIIVIAFVAVIVIGAIASFSLVALENAREVARDQERVADVRIMQTALELYFNDNGSYPADLSQLKEYLAIIPVSPIHKDGVCAENSDYKYIALDNNKSYNIDYCLGTDIEGMKAGNNTAEPSPAGSALEPQPLNQ